MPFVVTCQACGSKFQAPDHLAGKRGKCPKCSAVIDLVAAAAPAARSQTTAPAAGASMTAGERLYPCPDCGKMVSRRAQQCPQCGCPIVEPSSTAARASQPVSSPQEAEPSSHKTLLVAGGVVAFFVVAALVFAIVWATMSSPPAVPPAVAQPAPPPAAPKVTAEQKEAWIQEMATARAREVDEMYRKLHLATQLVDQFQQTTDLMQTLANTGDLPKPSAGSAAPQATPYESQFDALQKECSDYLRGNLPSGDYSRDNVLEVAGRWAKSKEAPLESQLEKFVEQQALLQGATPSAEQPAAQPDAQPAAQQ